jgi:hypothetical protein
MHGRVVRVQCRLLLLTQRSFGGPPASRMYINTILRLQDYVFF